MYEIKKYTIEEIYGKRFHKKTVWEVHAGLMKLCQYYRSCYNEKAPHLDFCWTHAEEMYWPQYLVDVNV